MTIAVLKHLALGYLAREALLAQQTECVKAILHLWAISFVVTAAYLIPRPSGGIGAFLKSLLSK